MSILSISRYCQKSLLSSREKIFRSTETLTQTNRYIRRHFAAMDSSRSESTSEIDNLKRELAEANLKVSELTDKLGKIELNNSA